MEFLKIKDLYFVRDLYFLFVIALMRMVSWFPSSLPKEHVVRTLASIGYRFSKNKKLVCEKNISLAFGEGLSKGQMQKIVKGAFCEFWREVCSLLPSSAERDELTQVDLIGMEHLHRALGKGCGIILWEHKSFGRRNMAKQVLHENRFSIYQVHAETHLGGFLNDRNTATWLRDNIIRPFFEKCEKRFVEDIIYLPSSGSLAFTRRLLDLLKQNKIICITGNGRQGQKLVPIKFLGRTRSFSTGMVSLAKISGAPILPIFCIEDENGKTSLIIEHPIQIGTEGGREGKLESIMAQYAGLLESYIRRYPEKYWGWHYVDRFSEQSGQHPFTNPFSRGL